MQDRACGAPAEQAVGASSRVCPSQDARETGMAGDSGDGGGAWKQVTGGQEVEMNLCSEYVCDREREREGERKRTMPP